MAESIRHVVRLTYQSYLFEKFKAQPQQLEMKSWIDLMIQEGFEYIVIYILFIFSMLWWNSNPSYLGFFSGWFLSASSVMYHTHLHSTIYQFRPPDRRLESTVRYMTHHLASCASYYHWTRRKLHQPTKPLSFPHGEILLESGTRRAWKRDPGLWPGGRVTAFLSASQTGTCASSWCARMDAPRRPVDDIERFDRVRNPPWSGWNMTDNMASRSVGVNGPGRPLVSLAPKCGNDGELAY